MRRVEHFPATASCVREVVRMSEATKPSPKGSDWTRLLTDPDLVSHLGKLLQTYREVPAEQRETALLRAMREIKDAAVKAREERENLPVPAAPAPPAVLPHPEPVEETPPFEPDLFTPQWNRIAAVFTGSSAMWRWKFTLKAWTSRSGAIWRM